MSRDDAAFLEAFEAGTLPDGGFRHRDHVRMTWLFLQRDGAEAAARRIAEGIRRFARSKGATAKYHETLTRAWVRLVAGAIAQGPAPASFETFLAAHPELAEKERVHAFYSPEALARPEAREGWVEPDRAPLP